MQFGDLKGKTLDRIEGCKPGSDKVRLFSGAEEFRLWHDQDCCESVSIYEIVGDVADLIGAEIVVAEESSNSDSPVPHDVDSYTWTFYRLMTAKGAVVIRWLGESNGYYSEEVSFGRVRP